MAEIYVMFFLILKGYRIKQWRMRNIFSEIDIIASKSRNLVAIEVKYRKTIDSGLYSITSNQQKRIRKALTLYTTKTKIHYETIRCDVCVVTHYGRIKHIVNAF